MTSARGSEPAPGAAPGAGARIRRPPRSAEGADCARLSYNVRTRAFPPESALGEGTQARSAAVPCAAATWPASRAPAPLPLPSWRC
jgi:hypothetical protein